MSRARTFSVGLVLFAAGAHPAPLDPPKVPKELLEQRLQAARKVYNQGMERDRAGVGLS